MSSSTQTKKKSFWGFLWLKKYKLGSIFERTKGSTKTQCCTSYRFPLDNENLDLPKNYENLVLSKN